MHKLLFLLVAMVWASGSFAQNKKFNKEEQAIVAVLLAQSDAWTKGDMEGYMAGYWQSDSLRFVGSRGITYGWKQTLENYKKGYPTPDHTGTLSFTVLHLEKTGKNNYVMLGKYNLERNVGPASGHFMLLWRKINGEWKVVIDHSS